MKRNHDVWKHSTLSQECEIKIGGTPSRDNPNYWNGVYPWVSIADMRYDLISRTKEKITKAGIDNSNVKLVKQGMILLSFKLSIGKTAKAGMDLYTNEAIAALEVQTRGRILPDYLFWYLRRIDLTRFAHGAAKGKSLNSKSLASIPLAFPSIETQEKIISTLNILHELRQKSKKNLELLNVLGRAIYGKMFGDPVPKSDDWEIVQLQEISPLITDGTHNTPKLINDGIPLISAKNVRDGWLDFTEIHYISKPTDELLAKRCKPQKWDLLLVCVGHTTGRNSLVVDDTNFNIVRSVALIRPDLKKLNPYYFQYFANSTFFQEQIKHSIHTSGQPGLYLEQMKKLRIVIPPLEIQNHFSHIVSKLHQLIRVQMVTNSKMEILFTSFMSRLFEEDA